MKWSRARLAYELRITEGYLFRIEKEGRQPGRPVRKLIAQLTGIEETEWGEENAA